jgi:hypothetical protein
MLGQASTFKGTVSPVSDELKMVWFNRAFPVNGPLDVLQFHNACSCFNFKKIVPACFQNTSLYLQNLHLAVRQQNANFSKIRS